MDDLKRFILPNRKGIYIMLGSYCVVAIAYILFVIIYIKDNLSAFIFVLLFVLLLSPFVILCIYVLMIDYPKKYKELYQLCNTPETQEDIIKDFREARKFWKGNVRIGERYIYARGEMCQRKEGSFFWYREEGARAATAWAVYLKTGIEEKKVLHWGSLFTSEEDIRYEVEKANWYLSDLDGIKEETRV